jgi:hypothetical protein
MKTEELIAALEYICQPKQPEYPNGFHPQTREAARAALDQLETLEARAAKAEARVKVLEGRIRDYFSVEEEPDCPPRESRCNEHLDNCLNFWIAWLLSEDQPEGGEG